MTPRPAAADPAKGPHAESAGEELASSITHGVGALLAISALAVLVCLAAAGGDTRRVVTVSIYGTTLLLMYLASTGYHLARLPRLKRRMRICDHASIYLLIAGTYTPVALVLLRGGWGWTLFGIIWGLAVAGVVLKLFFISRFEFLSVTLYMLMGWTLLIALRPVLAAVPAGGMRWLLAGGLAYTAGVGFYLWDTLPFNHAVWHLFVMAGSACHFFAVLWYVVPVR
jgi:hemolysin III